MPPYFSDSETGGRPRIEEVIGEGTWRGLRALVESRIVDGSFGAEFPEMCPDGGAIIGTDERMFSDRLNAEIPDVIDPELREFGVLRLRVDGVPPTMAILDLTQFCNRTIAKPREVGQHNFFRHSHLAFDQEEGQSEFRSEVNTILARNGLAYELVDNGAIERLAPVGLREDLKQAVFSTGDDALDSLLETARKKYLSPDESERHNGIEKLWDAFERIKTLEDPDKRRGAPLILDKAAPTSPKLREALEREMKELTKLGNELMIRHHETTKEPIAVAEHADHLFGRMMSLVRLVLKMSGRGG